MKIADISEKEFKIFQEIDKKWRRKERRKKIILYIIYICILGILSFLIITAKIHLPSFLEIAIVVAFIFSLIYPLYLYFIKSEIPPSDY